MPNSEPHAGQARWIILTGLRRAIGSSLKIISDEGIRRNQPIHFHIPVGNHGLFDLARPDRTSFAAGHGIQQQPRIRLPVSRQFEKDQMTPAEHQIRQQMMFAQVSEDFFPAEPAAIPAAPSPSAQFDFLSVNEPLIFFRSVPSSVTSLQRIRQRFSAPPSKIPNELKDECTTRRIPGKTPNSVKASSKIFPEVNMGVAQFAALVSLCSISIHCIDISASGTVGLELSLSPWTISPCFFTILSISTSATSSPDCLVEGFSRHLFFVVGVQRLENSMILSSTIERSAA